MTAPSDNIEAGIHSPHCDKRKEIIPQSDVWGLLSRDSLLPFINDRGIVNQSISSSQSGRSTHEECCRITLLNPYRKSLIFHVSPSYKTGVEFVHSVFVPCHQMCVKLEVLAGCLCPGRRLTSPQKQNPRRPYCLYLVPVVHLSEVDLAVRHIFRQSWQSFYQLCHQIRKTVGCRFY